MNSKSTLVFGCIICGLAVALGAFGAHALKPQLLVNNAVDTYSLAAQYQFYHGLALMIIGLIMRGGPAQKTLGWAAGSMILGVVMFSGSLYALAITGTRSVVLITPLGGIFFLLGWVLLAIAILKAKSSN